MHCNGGAISYVLSLDDVATPFKWDELSLND
jgi:hypothetical protein